MQTKKQIPCGKGRGRGILALTSFDPLPRPSKALVDSHLNVNAKRTNKQTENMQQTMKNDKPVNVVKPLPASQNGNIKQESPVKNTCTTKLLAKYNFTANPANPGGFKELSINQKDNLILVQKGHKETRNPLWWEVENVKGERGFVPANYCMVLDKPTALPWLENKKLEEEKKRKEEEQNGTENSFFGAPPTSTPVVKPYQSAYNENKDKPTGASAIRNFYCDICDKQLNGPTPYSMHMASKMHREEVEYQNSCQT